MDKNKKIYRKSGISVACYVFAVILLIYTFYTAGNTVSQINGYYAQYGMSAQPMEYVTYIAQNILQPLVYTVTVFMLGYILDAVRKTDPKNYMTEEEYEDAKAAKKEAREAKKLAKGEKKVAAKAVSDEQSMAEDFASDLDKELKAAERKGDNKKPGGYKKNYNPNRNGNNNHRQSGNKSGGNGNGYRNGNGNGNRRNNNQNNNQNNQNNNQNNHNNQSKPVTEEKKVAEAQEKPAAVFEAKVVEDK